MDKVQLITADDDLAIKLHSHLGTLLIHTDSVDNAVMNVSSGDVGTTVIHGYEKMSVLLRIVTFLRDACPSMAITCLVKPENVTTVLNSELKPYIYRVLPENISVGQIVLAINSSQKEHQALQKREASGENLTVQLDRKDFSDRLAVKQTSRMPMQLLFSCVCLGTLLLGWYFYNQQTTVNNLLSNTASASSQRSDSDLNVIGSTNTDTAEPSPAASAIDRSVVEEVDIASMIQTELAPTVRQIPSLLLAATNAQLNNQLIEPFSDNAVAYYQQVIQLEPGNRTALEGLQQVQQQLIERISIAIEKGNEQAAGADFLALRSLNPDHPELKQLQQQLLSTLDPKPAKTAGSGNNTREKTAQEISPERLEQLLQIQKDDLAMTRLAQIDNAININAFASASNLLTRPREDLGPYENDFQARTSRLYTVLTANINAAINAADYNKANEQIETLASLGFTADVNNFRQMISSATTPAPAPTVVEDVLIPARATNIVTPEYPQKALRRGTEGYVTLRFRVLASGAINDIEVVDSQPASLFNQAAIDAIEKSSFAPATRNGTPEEQFLEQKLNFQIQYKNNF